MGLWRPLHCGISVASMSALGHFRQIGRLPTLMGCPLHSESRHAHVCLDMSASCRFCCRSPLQAFLVGDSVAVMRFATGAGDDGAAESRPGAVFLFISSR